MAAAWTRRGSVRFGRAQSKGVESATDGSPPADGNARGTVPRRSFGNAFRVGRNNPNVASFPTRRQHDLRVVGRVAQHDDSGHRRPRPVADPFRRRLGRRPLREPRLPTILRGVVRNLKREAEAQWHSRNTIFNRNGGEPESPDPGLEQDTLSCQTRFHRPNPRAQLQNAPARAEHSITVKPSLARRAGFSRQNRF